MLTPRLRVPGTNCCCSSSSSGSGSGSMLAAVVSVVVRNVTAVCSLEVYYQWLQEDS
jgi:hypothetical protein